MMYQMVTSSLEKYKAGIERRMITYLSNLVCADCSCLNFSSGFDCLSFFFPSGTATLFYLSFPIISVRGIMC